MPNLGGGFISDEDIATVEHLLGQARQAEYEKIVKFIFDNFDSTPIKRFFDQGSDNDQ